MITIINRKTTAPPTGAVVIDIGRPNILRNRYYIGKDGTRAEVIEKHRIDLWKHIKANDEVAQELIRLACLHAQGKHVVLSCYCKPLPCHGDTIKAAIEWITKQPSYTWNRKD
jgi:hypothetical protein